MCPVVRLVLWLLVGFISCCVLRVAFCVLPIAFCLLVVLRAAFCGVFCVAIYVAPCCLRCMGKRDAPCHFARRKSQLEVISRAGMRNSRPIAALFPHALIRFCFPLSFSVILEHARDRPYGRIGISVNASCTHKFSPIRSCRPIGNSARLAINAF